MDSDVFDIGFTEMTLIGVMALIILGPERLPGVARTAGLWIGRARRMLSDVKRDIDREINQAELGDFREIKDSLTSTKSEIDQATSDVAKSLNDTVKSEVSDLEKSVAAHEPEMHQEAPGTAAPGIDAPGTDVDGAEQIADSSPVEPTAPATRES